jgi:multidrug efflux system outer membrane protein
MRNTKRLAATAILSAALLAACGTAAVGPQDSGVAAPAAWSRLPVDSKTADPGTPLALGSSIAVEQRWWKQFRDPVLDGLIAAALADNKTLQIAKARVEEARAGRRGAEARLMPEIDAVGTAQRGNQGYATNNKAVGIGEADIAATWEIDLFGRNQARAAQAQALLDSAEAGRRAVEVGLLAEIARNYFDLRDAERQIVLTERNLDTQKRTLALVEAQRAGALASDFDVQRAGAQLATTEALIPALRSSRDAARDRLAVLLGRQPGTVDGDLGQVAEFQPLDQHILVAAPAKVLAARPDIAVAERNFAASISAKKAADAALFPDISLTALFGAQAASPFSSTPWGVGLSLVQPVLDFGRIEAQIDTADAQQRQAYLTYQQTVLEALENMENALSSYLHETGRNASLTAAVERDRRAEDLAKLQFSNGYTGLLDVLVVERDLLDAEASRARSDADLRRDLVNIYAASGGGWSG